MLISNLASVTCLSVTKMFLTLTRFKTPFYTTLGVQAKNNMNLCGCSALYKTVLQASIERGIVYNPQAFYSGRAEIAGMLTVFVCSEILYTPHAVFMDCLLVRDKGLGFMSKWAILCWWDVQNM